MRRDILLEIIEEVAVIISRITNERIRIDAERVNFYSIIFFAYIILIFVVPFEISFAVILFSLIPLIAINNTPQNKRIRALTYAKSYLSPYTNVWNNLILTNRYCSVELTKNKEIIIKNLLVGSYKNHPAYHIKKINYDKDWNKLCYKFNYYTNLNDILEFFEDLNYQIDMIEQVRGEQEQNHLGQNTFVQNQFNKLEKNKTDINNASEIEITALPGISIVLSKKLIQKREEIGGFKTVEEVFEFLKLKPHFETQLRKMICVNKMQGTIRIKKYKERKIDL